MKIEDPIMNACVDVTKHDDGTYEIACKNKCWSVSDTDWTNAMKYAEHYFDRFMIMGAYESQLMESDI